MPKKSSPPSETFVALLRGINVGGKNILPMKDLVAMFERADCTNVRNYIQSGNVVFKATPTLAEKIGEEIRKEIDRRLKLRVPLVIRSAEEMRAVAQKNPLLEHNHEFLHVMFLAEIPAKNAIASLDPNRSPGDTFIVRGGEIFLSCPNGVAKTKLTNAYFDAKLSTTSTGRNWRTVLKLVEMCGD